MTPEQLRSLGLYALWAFIGATVATGLHLAQVLAGTDVIAIRPLAATFTASFFGALATALGTSQLTRFGSEQIAKQVDALKTQGVPKSEMVVLSQDDAASALGAPLSPEQRAVILADLKAELARDPAGRLAVPRVPAPPVSDAPLVSQPPTWLPPEGGSR